MLLSLQSHALRRGESSVVGEHPAPQSPHHPPPPSQLEPRSPHTPGLDDVYHSRRYVQLAQGLPSSSPSTCRWLGPGELKIVSEHPIAAGGFSNVWEGTHDGRKVVLKSYRCYVSFDVANVVSVRRNHAPAEHTANGSLAAVSQRSSHVGPPSPTGYGRSVARGGALHRGPPFRTRLRV